MTGKVIISNVNDWQNLISQMNSVNNVSDDFTETEINFNKFTVFAIFLEVKSNGWEIGTETVTENQNSISISTLETEYVTTVITQPFSIVKVPKANNSRVNYFRQKYIPIMENSTTSESARNCECH